MSKRVKRDRMAEPGSSPKGKQPRKSPAPKRLDTKSKAPSTTATKPKAPRKRRARRNDDDDQDVEQAPAGTGPIFVRPEDGSPMHPALEVQLRKPFLSTIYVDPRTRSLRYPRPNGLAPAMMDGLHRRMLYRFFRGIELDNAYSNKPWPKRLRSSMQEGSRADQALAESIRTGQPPPPANHRGRSSWCGPICLPHVAASRGLRVRQRCVDVLEGTSSSPRACPAARDHYPCTDRHGWRLLHGPPLPIHSARDPLPLGAQDGLPQDCGRSFQHDDPHASSPGQDGAGNGPADLGQSLLSSGLGLP